MFIITLEILVQEKKRNKENMVNSIKENMRIFAFDFYRTSKICFNLFFY